MVATSITDSRNDIKGRMILRSLIGLNCLIFLSSLFWPSLREALMLHSPALPTPPLATATLNWRALASYTFVHSGPFHLLFNMIFLWVLGKYLIARYGTRRMLATYISGAVAGGIGFLTAGAFFPDGHETALCGASAAVLALSGAVIAFHPGRKINLMAWITIGVCILSSPTLPALITHIFGFLSGFLMLASKKLIIS